MKNQPFFTLAMGERLRSLRAKAFLTQDEVAERMGLSGRSRNRYVNALERGRIGNPSLKTIALFLRACDAPWSEFTQVLVVPEPLPIDATAIEEAGFSPDWRDRLLHRVARQSGKYSYKAQMPGQLTPKGTKPLPLACRLAMARRLQDHRIVANIIEQDVREILATVSSATKWNVAYYHAAARQVVRLLWRKAKQGRKPTSTVMKEFLATSLAYWVKGGLDRDAIARVHTQTIRRFEQLQAERPELFPSRPESRNPPNDGP